VFAPDNPRVLCASSGIRLLGNDLFWGLLKVLLLLNENSDPPFYYKKSSSLEIISSQEVVSKTTCCEFYFNGITLRDKYACFPDHETYV